MSDDQTPRPLWAGRGVDDALVVDIMCEATSYFIQPEYAREALDALTARGYMIIKDDSTCGGERFPHLWRAVYPWRGDKCARCGVEWTQAGAPHVSISGYDGILGERNP